MHIIYVTLNIDQLLENKTGIECSRDVKVDEWKDQRRHIRRNIGVANFDSGQD